MSETAPAPLRATSTSLALSQYTVSSAAVTIIPTSAADVVTPLSATTPTSFAAGSASSLKYFSFTLTQPQLIVQLSLSGGGLADMYVSPAAVSTPYVDQSTAYWSATAYTDRNLVTIQPTDPFFFTQQDGSKPGRQLSMAGTYYVAVLVLQPSSSGDFSLQLTVTSALTNTSAAVLPLTLNSTSAVTDFLTAGVAPIKYYTFTVADTLNTNVSDLVVSLNTSCSDVYLSDVDPQPRPVDSCRLRVLVDSAGVGCDCVDWSLR